MVESGIVTVWVLAVLRNCSSLIAVFSSTRLLVLAPVVSLKITRELAPGAVLPTQLSPSVQLVLSPSASLLPSQTTSPGPPLVGISQTGSIATGLPLLTPKYVYVTSAHTPNVRPPPERSLPTTWPPLK